MSTRRLLLVLGVVAVLGGGAYLAYRKGYFAFDSDDQAEREKLREKPPVATRPADAATGWFQWRGPTRDGQAPAGAFRTDWDKNPPKQLWSVPCGGGYSSCVVVGGKLYTQDRTGGGERVLCIDVEKGVQLWAHSYPADYTGTDRTYATGPRSTPTVIGNRLYAVGGAGRLFCLELPADTGGQPRLAWEHDLITEFDAKIAQWGVACSPLVEGELVIVQPCGKKGSVAAFDRNSGELRWAAGNHPMGYSSPVAATVGDRRVIFALTGNALLAVNLDGKVSGTFDWRTDFSGNIATPLVVGDYVFISSAYGQGSALLRAEPNGDGVRFVPVYTRRGPRAFQNHHSTSVFKDNRLYGFDGTTHAAQFQCVEFDSGHADEDWKASALGRGSGTLVLAGNHLVIQMQGGDVALVEANPERFRLVAKLPGILSGNNNWATPALLDGRLYLRDEQKVVCLDVRP